jgi:hypothetical protein
MDDRDVLAALGRLAREGTDEAITPQHDATEQARFLEVVVRPPARRPVRWAVAFAVVASLALGAVVLWPKGRLGYAVEGASLAESGYVSAPADSIARVRFTDGSVAEVQPRSSMRVAETNAAGARLVLEEGRAELSVVKQASARWSVEAGPYAIAVTGTRFGASWSRVDETLRVQLHEGSVVVRGPLLQDGLSLRAGQSVVASLLEGRVQLDDEARRTDGGASSAAPEPELPSTASTALEPPAAGSAAPAASSSRSGEPPSPSWSRRVAAGDFASVLAEADQIGFDAVLESGSLDNLLALADAARYGKRGELSRRALMAVRRRFPSSGAARSAAFLLGRMADDSGSPGAAIPWYDAYLSEASNGTFAAEALGRRMRAVSRVKGAAAARPLAEEYLRRHPTGPHAGLARDILGP